MATTSLPTAWLRLIIFAVVLAALAEVGHGQTAIQWSAYKMADGLPEPVFHFISFTPQGKLVAARLNAPLASELNGYSITNFPAPPGCLSRICESPGGQRWAVVPQGLTEFKDGSWLLHPVPEINLAFHNRAASPDAPAFLPVRQGSVLFLLPDGLWEFVSESLDSSSTVPVHAAAQAQIGRFTGLAEARDEGLWISGTLGVAKVPGPARNVEPTTRWQEYAPPASLLLTNFSQPTPDGKGGVTLIADSALNGQKAVVLFNEGDWSVLPAGALNFFRAWRGTDDSIWATTANALFQWAPAVTNWIEHKDFSAGQIFDVAIEPDGAFWLGTGDGLFRGARPLWSRPQAARDFDSPVESMVADQKGSVFFVADNQLHELRGEVHRAYQLPPAIQKSQPARKLFLLKNGSLLVEAGELSYRFSPANDSFSPLSLEHSIPLGVLSDGTLCLYNQPSLLCFDGDHIRSLSNPPPVRNGDELLDTLFTSQNGDLWIGGGQTVLWRHNDKWERFGAEDHGSPESIVGFMETKNGQVWCAGRDDIWQFDGKKWSSVPARFNHINRLMQGRDGVVWLASNGGLFRYCGGIWMENGDKEGLPDGAVTALCEDQIGQTWAATAHGLAVFHAKAETDPPMTYVHWLGGNSHRLSEGDTLNLLFDGEDKWKVTPRERLLYSYQLDQHGWSPFQDFTMFSMPGPPAGQHCLQVLAMDRNGNVDPVSAMLNFTVVTPWFREARLWIILSIGAAMAIFFAGIALNRHRHLVRSYAVVEQKVAQRTRELEIATRELLHSQKMNALGTLAAGIAHDFNNILSIIKGSAQIIEDNLDRPEKVQTRVNRIKTVVQQGAEIVDAMLGFGRGSDGVAQPCDINGVVAGTVKLLGDRFLHEVDVKFEPVEGLPEVLASRDFVQQILLNFIFNAADAMAGPKKITLATQLAGALPTDIYLHPPSAKSFVLVSVKDEGAGIAPEIKARIFEPFFTTKALSTRRGTGLGLSMVYELAKRMGAGLAVHSVVGQGSTFTLILPVSIQTTASSDTKTQTEALRT